MFPGYAEKNLLRPPRMEQAAKGGLGRFPMGLSWLVPLSRCEENCEVYIALLLNRAPP